MKRICLDCDGTWIDLYGVENWLSDLQNENTRPYKNAKPLINLSLFARVLHKKQAEGWEIVIISWTSKNGTTEYNNAVKKTKMEWFKKHLPSVLFDEIHIVDYGTPKSIYANGGILFDDEERNRNEWENAGYTAFDEKNLIERIKALN